MSNQIHQIQYRVYYEDTDAQDVVYYANYLKFFERARTDFLREKNINQRELKEQENLMFVVANCQIDYKKPAMLDNLVTVKSQVESRSTTSVTMKQEMFVGETLLNTIVVRIVCVNSVTKKPIKIPPQIVEIFEEIRVE